MKRYLQKFLYQVPAFIKQNEKTDGILVLNEKMLKKKKEK